MEEQKRSEGKGDEGIGVEEGAEIRRLLMLLTKYFRY